MAMEPEGTERDPEPGRGDGPHEDLSLAADVEEPGPEGHGHGEAREDEGRSVQKRAAQRERVADRPFHEGGVGGDGVVARRQDDDGPYDEETGRWRLRGTPAGPARPRRSARRPIPSPRTRSGSRALLPSGTPGHEQAQLLVGRVGAHLADDPARIEHDYPVRERADLFELQRDEQYRLALGALLEDLAVDELYGPHVHAAGGLGRYQDPGVAGELPRENGFLLVAAGEGGGPGVGVGGSHVVGGRASDARRRMTFGNMTPNLEKGRSP